MKIEISEKEALVLFEYFERFDETDKLSFKHSSEYLVLKKIHGEVCKGTNAMFRADYNEQLQRAREEISAGFEGDVPCLEV